MKWGSGAMLRIWGIGVIHGIPLAVLLVVMAPILNGVIQRESRLVGALILVMSICSIAAVYSLTGLISGYISHGDIQSILNKTLADKLATLNLKRALGRRRILHQPEDIKQP